MTSSNTINYSAMLDVERFVQIKNDQPVTTSLKVAEAFGKKHYHVIRDIKALEFSEEFNASNFGCVDYIDSKGEVRPMYEMTKDGFMFLVMGFKGPKAAAIKEAYIRVFNQMAEALHAQRAEEAAQAWMMGDLTGQGVELDFGRDIVFAEYCDKGHLWLADWEIDRLLGYKMRNATQTLFFRRQREFPVDSYEIVDCSNGTTVVMLTPRAWAIIARYSKNVRASQLALAAVQHYVTPGNIEVDKHDYLRLAEYTLEARDKLRQLTDQSGRIYRGMLDARDATEDASLRLEGEDE